MIHRLKVGPDFGKSDAPLQCALQRSSIANNWWANTFDPVPSELPVVQRWRTDTCLPFSCKLYDVVMGKEPRLWNCPKSTCHRAFLDTMNPVEPSHVKNSPFLGGTRGIVLLSSRVWKDVNGWALEIGISCTYSNPVVTGGRKHTHTLLIHRMKIGPDFGKLGVTLSGYDAMMSWLRLLNPTDCIPLSHYIYINCLSTLRCGG